MAVVSADFLAGVLTNFRATFAENFEAAQANQSWRDITMEFPSNTDTETHNWLGTPPAMQDVTRGELQREGLFSFNYSLQNRTFKAAIEVERRTLEDDKLGLIMPRVRQLGAEAARHPGQLVYQLPVSNGLAFDGVAFFADTRVIGRSANIDNILTGTGVTVATFQADLAAARAAMRLFQDDNGRPMNLIGNTIMVPPGIEQLAYQALNANQGSINQPVIPSSEDGAFSSAGYKVIVNPFLTDANDWYLLHVSGLFKPFIWQARTPPALEGLTTPDTSEAIERDRFLYSVRYRGEAGYGDPRYAIRTTNT